MQLRLCQLKATGEIYYYLGELASSKGLISMYEKPSPDKQSVADIHQMSKLQFEVGFKLLTYTSQGDL